MSKILIVHGSFAAPNSNWFPWAKKTLEQQGHRVIVPKFPTPEGQSLESWFAVFEREFGALDAETILIGHSVGVGFILNILERAKVRVRAAFLIAGFLGELGLPDYDKVNASFVREDLDFKLIRENSEQFFIISGDNDPYVPAAKGQELSRALGTPSLIVAGGGHLNTESGYSDFPYLLQKILKLNAPKPA
jgi:hypothetical protein